MKFTQTNVNNGNVRTNVFGENIELEFEDGSEEMKNCGCGGLHHFAVQQVISDKRIFAKGIIVGVAITALVIAAAFGCSALWGLVL